MSHNFTLSMEIIQLLEWLLEHEESRIRVLIKKALHDGLTQKITRAIHAESAENSEELQEVFFDFLAFLESTLSDELEVTGEHRELQENLGKTMQRLNIRNIDPKITVACIQETLQELRKDSRSPIMPNKTITRQMLLGKLIKHWKPHSNDLVH